MAARMVRTAGLVLIAVSFAAPALAGWWDDTTAAADRCCGSIVRDIKRRQCWPEPFVVADRVTVRAPMVVMVQNGWRRENMLGEFHFDADSGQLNEAGRRKVRWIMTEVPVQHRTIYVHEADSSEATSARIVAVQQAATRYTPVGELPVVLPTNIPDNGWPADQVDLIGRKFQSSTPQPRLPAATTTGGGGSGGGN